MVGRVETLRRAHATLIADNPRTVVVRRKAKARSATGGYDETVSFVGLVTMRLAQESSGFASHAADTTGMRDRIPRWSLIASDVMQAVDDDGEGIEDADGPVMVATDLRARGPKVTDSFDTTEGHFEITEVALCQDLGETWGVRANLERID